MVLCTAWPLASLLLRGEVPREDELLALLPAVKLAAVFLLVRMTVLDQRQLVRVMRIIIWSGFGIALIAIAQTLRVGPVIDFLSTYTPAEQTSEIAARGSTTLASSIATGDVIAIGLILVIACAARGLLGRRERLIAGLVLAAGVLAAGQFSTWIAALVAAALILHQYPTCAGGRSASSRSRASRCWSGRRRSSPGSRASARDTACRGAGSGAGTT